MTVENKFFSDKLMREIRAQFHNIESDSLSGKRIWLESASGSLRLKSMIQALADQTMYADQLGRENPGSRHAGDVVARGIEDVKLFLGAESGTIMPAMSSTHAIYRAVRAVLAHAPKGNVVTTDLEHPSVYNSTSQFAEIYGKEWRGVHLDSQTGSVDPDAILEKVDKETCLVAMIHGSNMTGAVLDVHKVAREAKKINPDLYVLVDGVQYAPHAPLDVQAMGVDAYVFGPYKAFCVKGIGFAFLSDRLANLTHWSLCGKSENDWFLGSAEEATYAAWSAVVDYLCWLGSHFSDSKNRRSQLLAGMEASESHLEALLALLLEGTEKVKGLRDMGHVTLHGMNGDLSGRLCLILFNLDRMNSYQCVELYNRAGIRVHNRTMDLYSSHTLKAMGITEGVRLSACHYNTPEEIVRFLEVTEQLGKLSDEEIRDIPIGAQNVVHKEG